MRKGAARGLRHYLWHAQNHRCHWCNCETVLLYGHCVPLPDHAATLDHLDSRLNPERGTRSGELRKVMACHRCNWERGRDGLLALPLDARRAISGHGGDSA